MITQEAMLRNNVYENEILDVVDNQDGYTRSDLQGRVSAIVMGIVREAKAQTNQIDKATLDEIIERIASGEHERQVSEDDKADDYRGGFAEGVDQTIFMLREFIASA